MVARPRLKSHSELPLATLSRRALRSGASSPLELLSSHAAVYVPGAIAKATCAKWARGVYAHREQWTPNFGGIQFTLGNAWYTHLEENSIQAYFEGARRSDATVRRAVPGYQVQLLALASAFVGKKVRRRAGWCGPGIHVFPAAQHVARQGGDVHFDNEGLLPEELARGVEAVTLVLMIQPPTRGGGLKVWDVRFSGKDSATENELSAPNVTVPYGVGDLVVIDSYRLHQIQPFEGRRDRVSGTVHLLRAERGWEAWF